MTSLPLNIYIKHKSWQIDIIRYNDKEIEFSFMNVDTCDKFFQTVPIKALANFDKIVAKGLGFES